MVIGIIISPLYVGGAAFIFNFDLSLLFQGIFLSPQILQEPLMMLLDSKK